MSLRERVQQLDPADRDVLVFGDWPHWLALGRFAVIAGVIFFLGSTFFMRQKRQFPDLL